MKDYFGYKGKTCVVTGAASGMGKAATEILVDLGAKVYTLDMNEVKVPGISAYIYCYLSDKKSIDDAFAKIPDKIDKFFGFAGVSGEKHDAKTTIACNYLANWYIMNEYLSKRVHGDEGAVMICTSIGANRWYAPLNNDELFPLVEAADWDEAMKILDVISVDLTAGQAYTFSKRCAGYATMKFAVECAPKHVRVNSIKPGPAITGLTKDFMSRDKLELEEWSKKYGGAVGRAGEAREMAEPAVFLNSDMASYISGAELIIDYATDSKVYLGGNDMWLATKLQHKYVK